MPTPEKEALVQELTEEFRQAKSLVFADYRGLDVAAMTELRRRCRDDNVKFRVAKNTLSRLAMAETGLTDLGELLDGPTGLAIAQEDELAAARVLVEFARQNDKLELKGGVMEGRVFTIDEVKALAILPPKDQLIAQLLATIETPLVQVIGIVQNLLQDVFSCAEQATEGKGESAAEGGDAAAAADGDAPAAADDDAPAESEAEAGAEPAAPAEDSAESKES